MRFVDSNNIPYTPNKFLSYDDVLLIPHPSDIGSRLDPSIDLRTRMTSGQGLNVPIISANMDSVTESEMVFAMGSLGAMGILHRFYKDSVKFTNDIKSIIERYGTVAFSVGIKPTDSEVVKHALSFKLKSPLIVCVDVAHGNMRQVNMFIKELRRRFGTDIQIIGGNVCTPVGVRDLVEAGVDGVKVGTGSGSFCSTRLVTGHGVPQLTALMWARQTINGLKSNATIIADGGIRHAGDIVKALAVGADSVMVGGLLSYTDECPDIDGQKIYRGQSSKEFMASNNRFNVASEGVAGKPGTSIGPVKDILSELILGLRSGMTYSAARTLKELYDKATFIEISHNSFIEGTPHGQK